jgi:hypothetical protein
MPEVSKDPEVNFETKTLPLVEKLFGYKLKQLNSAEFTCAQLAQLANAILSENEKVWNEFQGKESEKVCSANIFSRKMRVLTENQDLTPEKLEQFWKTRMQLALLLNMDIFDDIKWCLQDYSRENDIFDIKQAGGKAARLIENHREKITPEIIKEILNPEDANGLLSRSKKSSESETVINTKYLPICFKELNKIFPLLNLESYNTRKVRALIEVNSAKYPILNRITTKAISRNQHTQNISISKKESKALKEELRKLEINIKTLSIKKTNAATCEQGNILGESCVHC